MWGLVCQEAPKKGWGLAASLLMDSAETPPWAVHDGCVCERRVHDRRSRTSVPVTSAGVPWVSANAVRTRTVPAATVSVGTVRVTTGSVTPVPLTVLATITMPVTAVFLCAHDCCVQSRILCPLPRTRAHSRSHAPCSALWGPSPINSPTSAAALVTLAQRWEDSADR